MTILEELQKELTHAESMVDGLTKQNSLDSILEYWRGRAGGLLAAIILLEREKETCEQD